MIKGIDVSKHQGNINWSHVKAAGIDFAILRAGYGKESSQVDSCFDNNYAGCKSNGIPCGCYWFSYATTVEEVKKEAEVFLNTIKGKVFEMPVYFDMESSKSKDGKELVNLDKMGKTLCTEIAKTFLNIVEKAGYFVGIYMSAIPLESYIDTSVRERYAVWVADYRSNTTSETYKSKYGIWQKCDAGTVNGISGSVDLDECYVDYPSKIKAAGLNGYKVASVKKTKNLTVIIEGVTYSGTLTEV